MSTASDGSAMRTMVRKCRVRCLHFALAARLHRPPHKQPRTHTRAHTRTHAHAHAPALIVHAHMHMRTDARTRTHARAHPSARVRVPICVNCPRTAAPFKPYLCNLWVVSGAVAARVHGGIVTRQHHAGTPRNHLARSAATAVSHLAPKCIRVRGQGRTRKRGAQKWCVCART